LEADAPTREVTCSQCGTDPFDTNHRVPPPPRDDRRRIEQTNAQQQVRTRTQRPRVVHRYHPCSGENPCAQNYKLMRGKKSVRQMFGMESDHQTATTALVKRATTTRA